MIDNYGRIINYIRVSLTTKCNSSCIYCMPANARLNEKPQFMKMEDAMLITESASKLGIEKIRYTGGEPLLFPDIEKLIYYDKKICNIKDISLTTNGILLSEKVSELKKCGLDRVNISLDTLDKEKYGIITRGGDIDKVMEGIEKCLELGLNPVKINFVVIKGINDGEIDSFIQLTKHLPIHVRFIEIMPIGEGKRFSKSFLSYMNILKMHPDLKSLGRETGTTAEAYKINGYKGLVQFISSVDNKFCTDCNRIRITSNLHIKPCLHSNREIVVNDRNKIEYYIRKAVSMKPKEHHIENMKASCCRNMMCQIGG